MARYVAISESEMSDFMGAIGFTELSVEQRGSFGRKPVKERVYEAPVGAGRIRVYSSVVGPATRDRGKDAIRVQYWVGDQKVYGSKRVHRTQNWRKNLLQRTEEIRESVESGPLSRIPKDSRGDLMTARRSRLPHERFWGSVNYPDIRESRRFEAASVLPKELKTDKITDRVMAWQYLIDDSEKQHQLLKLQTALKMGLITQDEILESLDRAMSKRTPTKIDSESLGAESKLSMAKKEELILEHLNKNRQTSKYDGKFENTEGGVVELLGITRAGVSKTLRDMEARGLIYARNLHVPGGRRKVQCWYVVGSGTERGFGAEALVRHDSKWKGIAWNEHELKTLTQDERQDIAQEMYEAWLAGDLIGVDVDEFYEKLEAETIYVRQMGDADQERIENELRSALRTEFQEMSPEEIESLVELGLDSKLSDLNNVIDIETFAVEFDEWAQQEMKTHGAGISFEDWSKEEGQKHGDMKLTDWADEEEESHDERYGAESFTPPASAVSAAKKGLAQRKKWGRGGLSPAEAKSQGIDSGVTRARKIASGKVSKHDVRRMSAFNRHRKNNNPSKKMPDGGPTAGTIAWNLWGGSAGVNWAKKKSAAMNAEDEYEYDPSMPSHTWGWKIVGYEDIPNIIYGGYFHEGVSVPEEVWNRNKEDDAESEDGFPKEIMYNGIRYYVFEYIDDRSGEIGVYHTDDEKAPDQVLHLYLNEIENFSAEVKEETLEELYEDYLEELDTYGHDGSVMSKSEYGRYLSDMEYKTFDAETMCRQCKIGNYESCLYGETFDTGGFWLSNCVPDPSMDAEEKLSKTSCCCGATESNPCACMKAATPMSCSAIEPKCACYKDLEKNAESEDYGVEPRWM